MSQIALPQPPCTDQAGALLARMMPGDSPAERAADVSGRRSSCIAGLVLLPFSVLGVGGFSAAMPGVVLTVTPTSETSSAMSVNYVVRSVGYSPGTPSGSAIGGPILAAGTGPGHLFPDHDADKPRPRPPTLTRDQPVRQPHSFQHRRFHAQGLLGQRLPHHRGPREA